MVRTMVSLMQRYGRYVRLMVMSTLLIGLLVGSGYAALTNEDCFKCHKEVNLAAGGLQGEARSLFIDQERFKQTLHGQKLVCMDCHEGSDNKTHLRAGYPKVNCLACHSELEGLYPYKAKERIKEKGLKIPEKKLMSDAYLQGAHGKAWVAGKENAPNCYDCHTIHYPLGAKNPASTVHRQNLKKTCSRCHKERQVTGLLSRMATFRVQAHRKADQRFTFTKEACVDCHQGDAAHGEKELTKAPCQKCHEKKIQKAGLMFGSFHLFPDHDKQFGVWSMRNLYGFVVAGIITLLALWGLYAGLRKIAAYYQKEENQ
ncbi:MAG: hypothetical protein JXO49_03225 [Deltaproteobacteria bacterium]|nr:hypothetical protein [Candidatus Anaeroferrophillus wilburensis]MBN2888340.1 hypothetical protein [Deltaproteobacteria bacterium]